MNSHGELAKLIVTILEHPGPLIRSLDDIFSSLRFSEAGRYSDTLKTFLIGFDVLKWFGVAAALRIVGIIERAPKPLLRSLIALCMFLGTWDAARAVGVSETLTPVAAIVAGFVAYLISLRKNAVYAEPAKVDQASE